MRTVVQRVSRAAVRVDGRQVAAIDRGLLLLVGIERNDAEEDVRWQAAKLASLRIFEDEGGRMNRDLAAVGGAVLAVSQFTLAGSVAKGRRPSFDGAMEPERAEKLFQLFVSELRRTGVRTEVGVFRAMMDVELINDGPVTFVVDR